ncbi:MAG: helix-turn-helix domain-containing protein [Clostridiales bacterium]|nr:helix-turn-helix domain-containing protein [Clostridiales bacterium]
MQAVLYCYSGGMPMLLLDTERMQELMKSFYTLTGMTMSVIDLNGSLITGYPTTCPFCHMMRQNPAFMQRCMQCDKEHFRITRESGTSHRYLCHAGLMEIFSPVKRDGTTLCYIQLGQVIREETMHLDRMHIFDYAHHQFGLDGEALAQAINALPPISEEKFVAYQTLFEAITLHLHSTRVVALSDSEFLGRLEEYVDHHLDQDITSADLCRYFQMSRTQFYNSVKTHLQTPLNTYIRTKRILKAEHLLKENKRSISQVAQAVGFDDYSYFCRIFKQTTGLTPREYRMQKITAK